MNIGLMHYRIFETDGVSLEMEKWAEVLSRMGHKVFFIGGNQVKGHICMPSLNYTDEAIKRLNRACYESLGPYTEFSLKEEIQSKAADFRQAIVQVIKEHKIDLIVPNNLFSLGIHLHIALGLYQAIKETGVYVVGHHHDFYYERPYYANPTSPYVAELLDALYPPKDLDVMRHVVINEIAARALDLKKGLQASVVPNVFDFEVSSWEKDDFNRDFRASFGIGANDIVLLQGTRVTNRKAIELAIDVAGDLTKKSHLLKGKTLYDGRTFPEDGRVVLLAVGLHEGLDGYEEKLLDYAKAKGVDFIMKEKHVDAFRAGHSDHKIYSLWDAYTACDMITYPSIFEGWGNQFLEGLFAKKPILVFEYSVYGSDIKPLGFKVVSLGASYTMGDEGLAKVPESKIDRAGDQIMELLTDGHKYRALVQENFEIGRNNLGYNALQGILERVFS